MINQQLAGGAGFDARQTLGVLGQLVATRGQQLGRDNLAPQLGLEKSQCRGRFGQMLAHLILGAGVHGLRVETLTAVVDQGLIHSGRQIAAIAFLGCRQRVIEMRPLIRPASDLVQIIQAV